MHNANFFFGIFLAMIILTRIFLLHRPFVSPKIGNFRMHHWMTGIILMFISFFVNDIYIGKVVLYAVGLALLVDEIPLILTNKGGWTNYESWWCLSGVFLLVIVVYVFRANLLFF